MQSTIAQFVANRHRQLQFFLNIITPNTCYEKEKKRFVNLARLICNELRRARLDVVCRAQVTQSNIIIELRDMYVSR